MYDGNTQYLWEIKNNNNKKYSLYKPLPNLDYKTIRGVWYGCTDCLSLLEYIANW